MIEQDDTGGSYTLRPDSLGHVVAASAYNLLLNYYDGDYKPISGVAGPDNGVAAALTGSYKALFNGNISSMGTRVRGLDNTLLYSYQYDCQIPQNSPTTFGKKISP